MINVWIALRGDADSLIKTALDTDPNEYTGPVKDREYKIFKAMHDRAVVQSMFKVPAIGGNTYHAYSIYFESNVASKAKTELDYLSTEYPSQFFILGAWKQNGIKISLYPLHANAWRIMPDLKGVPATSNADLRDINLLAGQSPRNFNV